MILLIMYISIFVKEDIMINVVSCLFWQLCQKEEGFYDGTTVVLFIFKKVSL